MLGFLLSTLNSKLLFCSEIFPLDSSILPLIVRMYFPLLSDESAVFIEVESSSEFALFLLNGSLSYIIAPLSFFITHLKSIRFLLASERMYNVGFVANELFKAVFKVFALNEIFFSSKSLVNLL